MIKNKQSILDKNQYFSRQIQLWGNKTQKELQDKRVVIIGSGGLGCSVAIALGGSGIGYIDLVDFDTVSFHNIHRQIAFNMNDEGFNKANILKKHLEHRNPFVTIQSFESDFESFAKGNNKYDLIIDATDNLVVREKIDQFAKKMNIPWIYGSVESFHGQVCFFDKASFESVFTISNHQPEGIAAPIVMHIASLQANIALRYLAKLQIQKDILHYCYFDTMGEYHLQKFTLPQ